MHMTDLERQTLAELSQPPWVEFASRQAPRCYRPAMQFEISLRHLIVSIQRREYLERWHARVRTPEAT